MPDHSPQSHAPNSVALAASAATSHLAPCIYLGFQCSHCGDVRQALAELPSSAPTACPQCGTSCASVVLGRGFTRKKLPFSEVRRTETKLLLRRDEIPTVDSPALCLSG